MVVLFLLGLLMGGTALALWWESIFSVIWTPIIITIIGLWYVLTRWDFIPDMIPVLGWSDDLAVCVLVLVGWLTYFGLKFMPWVQGVWASDYGKYIVIGGALVALILVPKMFEGQVSKLGGVRR